VAQTERLKRPWPEDLADYWRSEVTKAFPEAIVDDYTHLEDELRNDPGDRHVLVAAIRAGADVIVTFNRKLPSAERSRPATRATVGMRKRFKREILSVG